MGNVTPTWSPESLSPEKFASETAWSPLHRIAFRFICIYLVLYCLTELGRSSVLNAGPGIPWRRLFQPVWNAMDIWVAFHIFHQRGQTIIPGGHGSGDTLLDYVQVFCFLVFAAAGTVLWSVIDKRRKNYRRADAWLRVLVRYTLALVLLWYGLVKVFPLQFPNSVRKK